MSTFSLVLAYLAAIGDQWVALMTGGAIILALALIERFFGKPVSKRTFVIFAAIVLLVAGFLAWRDEYVKNIGTVNLQFYLSNVDSVPEQELQEQIIIVNTTARVTVIRTVGLGRVYLIDNSANLRDQVSHHCKEMVVSPQNALTEGMPKKYKLHDQGFFHTLLSHT